jgi:RNA polymerase subunit RPABC4/transcription elongation factor Spt4
MSDRTGWIRTVTSLAILWLLVLGGAFAVGTGLIAPVRASTCDQGGGLVSGNWTITTVQVCSGIVYTVDGSINIDSGGSLTLVNGGLTFAMDTSHEGRALNVNTGGELILDNSIVTTQTVALAPYLKLALTVSGANSRFTMRNGAMLRFPGWFNATGATINASDSTITGFAPSDLSGVGVYVDDNDDGPVLRWDSTTASLYRSRIERIYENVTAQTNPPATGIVEANVTLASGSTLYAYDSYIGVDYSDVPGLHNELQVDATSSAYLYNVTIDLTEDPSVVASWQPAFVPLGPGGSVSLLRWLRATVVDSTGFPLAGAAIWSILSPNGTTAQYPDNGFSATPSPRTLFYLGRSASGANAWNATDLNGAASIPLYTDRITTSSMPNADSFGNYQLAVTYGSSNASGGAFFNPYPAVSSADNNRFVTVPFGSLVVRTGPDLALHPSDYGGPLNVTQGQPFTVNALIYNQGQTTATDVSIAAFLDGNRSAQVARADGLTISLFLNESLSVARVISVGPHTLMLVADPDNAINEGGPARESNNFANITLNVQPPPAGFIAILSPVNGQTVEPGGSLSVTGYARDISATGILGVALTIELRSGSTVLATNRTTSGNQGFFLGTISVPGNAPDGGYTISVTPSLSAIQPDTRTITVHKSVSFLLTPVPLLGIPWWLFLILIAAVAAIAIGVTLYFKIYGLGKMVECGECGAFISVDAMKCPKCGVEFEKDMAKCSNCQAWIPVDMKECPECGVEFTTGELAMADYQVKMQLQYEEVAQKLKEEAERQVNRSMSDREFQEWWRKQPTFITFEEWLREEEEVRKKGSKPCRQCGTLNSVTARVCHMCGSPMIGQPPVGRARSMPLTSRTARPSTPTKEPPDEGEKAKGAQNRGDKTEDDL